MNDSLVAAGPLLPAKRAGQKQPLLFNQSTEDHEIMNQIENDFVLLRDKWISK